MFGKPFDETKYNRVIQACMLTNDIGRFPNGDLVFVGEHGARRLALIWLVQYTPMLTYIYSMIL